MAWQIPAALVLWMVGDLFKDALSGGRQKELAMAQVAQQNKQQQAQSQALATLMERANLERRNQMDLARMNQGSINQNMLTAMMAQRLMGGSPQPYVVSSLLGGLHGSL